MATPIYYPPTQNGLQKTLASDLDAGVTASATLNNTTNVQNLPGIIVIDRIDTNGIEKETSLREYISFTGTSGATITTLTRGLANSTDQDHATGAVVEFVPDITWAQMLADALNVLVDSSDVTSLNSAIVTLTGTQTLTNKTLTAPKIADAGFIADANGNEQIVFQTTGSAVNELEVTNATAGNAPSLGASGEANVDLILKSKGTGKLRLGQATTTGIQLEADQSILDSAGNEYIDFGKTSSAVNQIKISNAATTNGPIIEAEGETNVHLIVRGKGNGLTKFSMLRQDNTTDTYKHDSVILHGWGYITGDGAATRMAETVSFGITFDAEPNVLTAFHADAGNGATPTDIGDFISTTDNFRETRSFGITTGQFTFEMHSDAAFANGYYFGYSWIAIGEY